MINSLQFLRYLFALMIFHHHFFLNPQIVQFGAFPVAFFFILSGFVMTKGYEEKVLANTFNYKTYIKKRIIKILPLNVICLGLYLLIPVSADILNSRFSFSNYFFVIPDILMIQAWIPIKEIYFSGNAVAWFLSDILFCYLMFPFLLKLIKSKYGNVVFICILTFYFVFIQFIKGDALHSIIYINPLFRIIDFMIGILLLSLSKSIFVFRKSIRPLGIALFEMLSFIITILSLIIYPYVSKEYSLVALYWVPSIFLILAFSQAKGGPVSSFFCNPFLTYLGSLSFPFYMIHTTIIGWYQILASRTLLVHYEYIGAAICIVSSTLIAHFYVKKFEPLIASRINMKTK